MISRLAACCAALFLMVIPMFARSLPQEFAACSSLNACIRVLDEVAPSHDGGSDLDAAEAYKVLHRFGDPAKHELLKKAAGKDPGWRNFAGAVLAKWKEWNPSDVPELRAALRKDHGGWVARPLAEIATPGAIEALVEDLPEGSANQTDFALSHLGPKALPFLFPLLAEERTGESAARVIGQMTGIVETYAPRWIAMASDAKEPKPLRIKALAGLAALGPAAKPYCASLRQFLNDPDAGFQFAVHSALLAVRDSSTAVYVARSCKPKASPLDSLAMASFQCLEELASYGTDGYDAGAELLPFLKSKNGAERAYAITTLGAIGYEADSPEIENALNDRDWRVVYASARSLGWLGAQRSVPALQKTASEYWLPEIRGEARRAIQGIHSPNGKLSRILKFGMFGDDVEPFDPTYSELNPKVPGCRSGEWKWNETVFRVVTGKDSLRIADGVLRGTNNGEFGGELTWHPRHGKAQTIQGENVLAIEPDGEGAIVLFGLAHISLDYGYAVRVSRDENGVWQPSEIARLPGQASGLVNLGDGLFATESGGSVAVFSPEKGILGLASCQN